MKKQSGFTLIELVIVVVILGLLAVTAIPKFIDLTDQAKQANIEGMAGGFATGISLGRAQWEAEGRPKNSDTENLVSFDGTVLYLTVEILNSVRPGYVIGTVKTGDVDDVNCINVWNSILQQPPTITGTLSVINGINSSDFNYYATLDTSTDNDPVCHYYLKNTLNKTGNNFDDPNNSTGNGNSFTYQPKNSSVIVYINQ